MSHNFSFDLRRLPTLYVAIPLGIVLLALVLSFIGWLRRQSPPQAMPPQAVVLAELEARDFTETWEYVAQLEADQIVDLKARVSGFLLYKDFAAGDQVRRDQVLFQIEPDQYQALLDIAEADVLSAQAQFDLATLDFNRISDLYVKQTSPKSEFDSSKAAFEVAEAQLKSARAREIQARLNRDYASIRAPFDGRINDTPYSEGSLLGPESGVLATVVSTAPVLAVFGLSNQAVAAILPPDQAGRGGPPAGWRVRLRLAPGVYHPQAGQLVYMSPTVDAQTDTVKFKARFENADSSLLPGQIVTAVLERAESKRRLPIPKEAVLTDTGGRYVMMAKEVPGSGGLVAEKRPIVLDKDETEREYFVREGLEAGDKFILKGLLSGGATLRPGAPVRLLTPPVQAGAAQGQGQQGQGQQGQGQQGQGGIKSGGGDPAGGGGE